MCHTPNKWKLTQDHTELLRFDLLLTRDFTEIHNQDANSFSLVCIAAHSALKGVEIRICTADSVP